MAVESILVDFDGTACATDVAGALCTRFCLEGWEAFDEAVQAGTATLRHAIRQQATMLQGERTEMLSFARANFAMDASFSPFVRWATACDLGVVIVSDGFGFYIEPMLADAGLSGLPVVANRLVGSAGRWRLDHPHGHPQCVGCGTCKMLAVLEGQRRSGAVAFVGEGQSDRYGAAYADLVFAKERLAVICSTEGIPYVPWTSFDDVREILTSTTPSTPRSAPPVCPGWTPSPDLRR